MPALLTEIGRIFVGRDRELEQLAQLWKEAEAGDRRLALLAGEPGVGKTRLAAELAGRVHAEDATVLAGRCDEDLGVPYQPFVEALRQFVEHTPPAQLGPRLGRHAGELVRLLPDLAVRVPGLPPLLRSDPETERYRLFDAVAAWLAAASADQPLLLVLDDLQWAAKPTLLLLRHVVRSPDLRRVLVLGIYRHTELGHDHPLVEVLADLRRQGGVERFSLVGLDSSGVAAFIEQAAGGALDDADLALARAIHEETEGNPFFVREVLRHLTETGAVERRGGRWFTRLPVEEVGIPEGVRDVVGRRLSRLSKEANRVLRVAAVVGPEFELPVLRATEDFEEEDLFAALEEASEARLVLEVGVPGARYRFAHALVRDTLYGALSGARRVALHKRVAEAIEAVHAARLDDQLPALAHHYARAAAPAPETTKAVEYATRAGDRALAQLAHDEAVAYYRQGLELFDASEQPPDEAKRVELLIALGEAERRAGDAGYRETLLRAARLAQTRGDVDALARAALANSPGSKPATFGATDTERVSVLEAAIEAVGADDTPVRARLLAILALELFHDRGRERRLALSDEALAIARRLDDPATLSHILVARPFAIGGPDTLAERLANTAELLEVAERLADPATAHRAWWLRFRIAIEVGDPEEADRCLEAEGELIAELGQPIFTWMTSLQRIAWALRTGDLGEAERLAHATFEQGRVAGQADAPLYFAIHVFQLGYEQGRWGEAQEALSTVMAAASELPAVPAMLAVLHAELGRLDDAKALFEVLAEDDFAHLAVEASWVVALCLGSIVCATLGDAARAAALHRLLAPYPDHIAVFAVGLGIGSVSHYLGLLATTMGDLEEADARFASAERIHSCVGAPTWLARTRFEWARMLLARGHPGDAERASGLLGQALATARELGLGNVERQAVVLLQKCP